MDIVSKGLEAQLGGLIKHAKIVRCDDEVRKVVEEHQGLFDRYRLRLRPSVGCFSLVSCHKSTPQLGYKSPLKTAAQLTSALKNLQSGHWKLNPPGRETPEKDLQSWLILSASVTGEVTPLTDVFGDGCRYWLVSDEIALVNPSGSGPKPKFVADMLLVKEAPDGRAELLNAELKYSRSFETFEQVVAFRKVLEQGDLLDDWRAFAETMTGKTFNWSDGSPSSGLVIWPGLPSGMATPPATARKFREKERIRVLSYRSEPFSLALEHA